MSNERVLREGQYFANYGQVKEALNAYSTSLNQQLVVKKSKLINGELGNYKYVVFKFKDCHKKCSAHIRINRKASGPNRNMFHVVKMPSEIHYTECAFGLTVTGSSSQIQTRLMYLGLGAYNYYFIISKFISFF